MNRLIVVAAASVLAVVLAATLFLYAGSGEPRVSETQALELPADLSLIYTEVNRSYNTLDGSYVAIHENVIDSRRHCEFCSVIEFYDSPAGGTPEVSWSAGDRAFSMEGAGKISFYAMGDEGGETVRFKAAGKRLGLDLPSEGGAGVTDGVLTERIADFVVETTPVTLTDKWQKFEIDLSGKDLTDVSDALAVEVGDGQSGTLWVKGLTLEDEPAADPFALEEEEV